MTDSNDAVAGLPFPAICAKCGAVFPFRNLIAAGPGAGFGSLQLGNIAAPCPTSGCPGPAKVIDGDYTLTGRVFGIVRTINPSDLAAAQRILGELMDSKTPVEQSAIEAAAERLTKEAPSAVDLLRFLRDPAWQGVGGISGVVAVIVAIIVAARA